MGKSSRRGFLRAASGTAAGLALTGIAPAWAAGAAGPVRVRQTFRERRYAEGEALAWKPVSAVAADAIVLDPATAKQEVLGFGGALTDASCYVLSQMKAEERAAVMHDLFSAREMDLNV